MSDLLAVRNALLDATERLTTEYSCLPAGSVIRRFAREVALARRIGTPHDRLAEIAEARTRVALARRRGLVEGAVAAG